MVSRVVIASVTSVAVVAVVSTVLFLRPSPPVGSRLQATLLRANVNVFVRDASGPSWQQVTSHDDVSVTVDGGKIAITDVVDFAAAWPDGEVVDTSDPSSLPAGFQVVKDADAVDYVLRLASLSPEVRVDFTPLANRAEDHTVVATSLTNTTDRPFQVVRFAVFNRTSRDTWDIEGGFFTAAQFAKRYDCADGLLLPGVTVVDVATSGKSRTLYAYELSPENGPNFWVGGIRGEVR